MCLFRQQLQWHASALRLSLLCRKGSQRASKSCFALDKVCPVYIVPGPSNQFRHKPIHHISTLDRAGSSVCFFFLSLSLSLPLSPLPCIPQLKAYRLWILQRGRPSCRSRGAFARQSGPKWPIKGLSTHNTYKCVSTLTLPWALWWELLATMSLLSSGQDRAAILVGHVRILGRSLNRIHPTPSVALHWNCS